jgi:hypothetical protein
MSFIYNSVKIWSPWDLQPKHFPDYFYPDIDAVQKHVHKEEGCRANQLEYIVVLSQHIIKGKGELHMSIYTSQWYVS